LLRVKVGHAPVLPMGWLEATANSIKAAAKHFVKIVLVMFTLSLEIFVSRIFGIILIIAAKNVDGG
jgi:hypothetical protein